MAVWPSPFAFPKEKEFTGVFGRIYAVIVSSAVSLFVPKLRFVWILWCKIGVSFL
jgi:hypothetical protein